MRCGNPDDVVRRDRDLIATGSPSKNRVPAGPRRISGVDGRDSIAAVISRHPAHKAAPRGIIERATETQQRLCLILRSQSSLPD